MRKEFHPEPTGLNLGGYVEVGLLSADAISLVRWDPSYPDEPTDRIYNVNGTLYWNGSPVGTGTDKWSYEGAGPDIYYTAGNVGIGTVTPTSPLHVGAEAKFDAAVILANTQQLQFQDTLGGLTAYAYRDASNNLVIVNATAAKDIQLTTSGGSVNVTGDLEVTGSGTFGNVVFPDIHTNTQEPTGFVDRTAVLSWDDGTRTLTITGDHSYYLAGVLYEMTTDSLQIADTTGVHFIYYDTDGVLKESATHPGFIYPNALVATVYWNSSLGKGLVGNERHGTHMDGVTHQYLHSTVGTRYGEGLTGSFLDASFTVTAGEIWDEDIQIEIAEQTQCLVLYKDGSTTYSWDGPQATYYKMNGANLRYNSGNALADVGPNQYVAYWIFATNDITTPIVSIMGQRVDTTLADARNNNTYESMSLGTLPYAEMKLLYRVILRNTGSPPTRSDTHDYRSVSNLPAGTYVATDHGVLTGLTDDDHTQYLLHTRTGDAQGDVLYRDASGWVSLPAGTDGMFLQTRGAAANPQWAAPSIVAADEPSDPSAFTGMLWYDTDATSDPSPFPTTWTLATPSVDQTAQGVLITLTANEDQAIGDACRIGATGKAVVASANAVASAGGLIMVAQATIDNAASGSYCVHGVVRDDSWAWTPGGLIYLSATGTTGNTLTQTAPAASGNVVQILGVALSATTILFEPQLVQVEIA